MIKNTMKKMLIGGLVFGVLFGGLAIGGTAFLSNQFSAVFASGTKEQCVQKVSCVRVVDGDTYILKTGQNQIKVRLIGVDTPESVHADVSRNTTAGKEVSNIVKKRLTGKVLWISRDIGNKDKYGRYLRYVWFKNPKKYKNFIKYSVNGWLVKKGYAKVMTIQPNVKYVAQLKSLEQKAKTTRQGILWS